MIAPTEGSIWADYWAAREARAVTPACLFDKAIGALQDIRAREGSAHAAQDLAMFDAVLTLLAGIAVRKRS